MLVAKYAEIRKQLKVNHDYKSMNYLRFLCVKYHILDFFGNGLKRGS